MAPMFAIAVPIFYFLRSDASLPAFIVFYALAGEQIIGSSVSELRAD